MGTSILRYKVFINICIVSLVLSFCAYFNFIWFRSIFFCFYIFDSFSPSIYCYCFSFGEVKISFFIKKIFLTFLGFQVRVYFKDNPPKLGVSSTLTVVNIFSSTLKSSKHWKVSSTLRRSFPCRLRKETFGFTYLNKMKIRKWF